MIRLATDQDLPKLIELAKEFHDMSPYSELAPFDPGQADRTYRLVTGGLKEAGVALVSVNKQNEPVGFLMALKSFLPMSDRTIASELAWWVTPKDRRGKNGLELLGAYEYWARNIAKVDFVQVSWLEGKDLSKFYIKRGYVKTENVYIQKVS